MALTCQVKHVSAALEEELEALDTDNARFEQHLNAVTATANTAATSSGRT